MNLSYNIGILLYILSIFILGLYPKVRILPIRFDPSFLFHFTAFFLLYIFLSDRFKRRSMSLLIALLIAMLIELLQGFVPSRSSSFSDFIYDLAGITMGVLVGSKGWDLVFKFTYSFLGIGYVPMGPGTLASLVFVVFVYFLKSVRTIYVWQLFVILLPIAIIASQKAENLLGKDPSTCVIDEVVGMAFPLMFLKFNLKVYTMAFLCFRFFDIIKPLGIKRLEKVSGGIGIVLDDLVAGVYSLIAVKLVIAVLSQFGVNL